MSLVEHAQRELELAGLFDEDSDYDGMLGTAALEIVKVFADQGHSGYSAMAVTQIVTELMQFKPLTPLTSNSEDWTHVAEEIAPSEPNGLWQSKRRPSAFSRDGGQTWYDIDDPSVNNGDVWQRDN